MGRMILYVLGGGGIMALFFIFFDLYNPNGLDIFGEYSIYVVVGIIFGVAMIGAIVANWANKKDKESFLALPKEDQERIMKGASDDKRLLKKSLILILIYVLIGVAPLVSRLNKIHKESEISDEKFRDAEEDFRIQSLNLSLISGASDLMFDKNGVLVRYDDSYEYNKVDHYCPANIDELRQRGKESHVFIPVDLLYAVNSNRTVCHVGVELLLPISKKDDYASLIEMNGGNFDSRGILDGGFDGTKENILDVVYRIE